MSSNAEQYAMLNVFIVPEKQNLLVWKVNTILCGIVSTWALYNIIMLVWTAINNPKRFFNWWNGCQISWAFNRWCSADKNFVLVWFDCDTWLFCVLFRIVWKAVTCRKMMTTGWIVNRLGSGILSMFWTLCLLASILSCRSAASDLSVDNNGYVLYCPCMGMLNTAIQLTVGCCCR